MGVYIKGIEMPKDCPMCPMAHWNSYDEFTGCEVVVGKKYAATTDPEYMESTSRPDWCPLAPVPPHGRCIDADEFLKRAIGTKCFRGDYALILEELAGESTTIIPAEESE